MANLIALAEAMATGNFTGALTHLIGGIDGTIAAGGVILVDTDYLYVTVAENTVSGKYWRRISVGSVY